MCRTRLTCRFPARDSRWRTWSPEDASIGAVPFQEAKCPRLGNRAMSPASTRSRAAPDGPIPSRAVSVVPAAFSAAVSSLSAAFLRWWIRSRSLTSSAATRRRACPAGSRGRTGPAALGLGRGQGLLRPARDQLQQQPVQLADHPGVVLAQGPAPVRQDPQDLKLLIPGDPAQPGHPGGGQRNGVVCRRSRCPWQPVAASLTVSMAPIRRVRETRGGGRRHRGHEEMAAALPAISWR